MRYYDTEIKFKSIIFTTKTNRICMFKATKEYRKFYFQIHSACADDATLSRLLVAPNVVNKMPMTRRSVVLSIIMCGYRTTLGASQGRGTTALRVSPRACTQTERFGTTCTALF